VPSGISDRMCVKQRGMGPLQQNGLTADISPSVDVEVLLL
jgi:hypothetical protein